MIVPDNSKKLVIVSKLRAANNEVLFVKCSEMRTKNAKIFPFEEHDNLFFWKTVNSTGTENCNLVSRDRLSFWPKLLGYNNIEDLLESKDHAIGHRISNHEVGNCETCQLNKSKKPPVPNDSGTRARNVLEIVHTDVFGLIDPKACRWPPICNRLRRQL